MGRAKNMFQRAAGRLKLAGGRLMGNRRAILRGRAEQAKADLKDDLQDLKDAGRKAKGS